MSTSKEGTQFEDKVNLLLLKTYFCIPFNIGGNLNFKEEVTYLIQIWLHCYNWFASTSYCESYCFSWLDLSCWFTNVFFFCCYVGWPCTTSSSFTTPPSVTHLQHTRGEYEEVNGSFVLFCVISVWVLLLTFDVSGFNCLSAFCILLNFSFFFHHNHSLSSSLYFSWYEYLEFVNLSHI